MPVRHPDQAAARRGGSVRDGGAGVWRRGEAAASSSCCIACIWRRIFKMISIPARFTPSSRLEPQDQPDLFYVVREYSRVRPVVRLGRMRPFLS